MNITIWQLYLSQHINWWSISSLLLGFGILCASGLSEPIQKNCLQLVSTDHHRVPACVVQWVYSRRVRARFMENGPVGLELRKDNFSYWLIVIKIFATLQFWRKLELKHWEGVEGLVLYTYFLQSETCSSGKKIHKALELSETCKAQETPET